MSTKEIQKAVFDFLSSSKDPESFKVKDVRNHVIEKFHLNFKDDASKKSFRDSIQDAAMKYFESISSEAEDVQPVEEVQSKKSKKDKSSKSKKASKSTEKKSTIDLEDEEARIMNGQDQKTGKFTAAESNIVSRTMTKYCEDLCIDMQNLSPYYRDNDDNAFESSNKIGREHRHLWSNLQNLLPYRKRESIYQHAMRLILKQDINGTFTDKEKDQLLKLVDIYGRDFTKIGKMMGKKPDDCKQILIRLNRKKCGPYSIEEDRSIVDAVNKVMNNQNPNTLPEGKISWVEVAAQLNDERIPLDYNRRWRNIIRMNQKFNYPFETDNKIASKVLIKSSKNEVEDIENEAIQRALTPKKNADKILETRIALLSFLQNSGFEDITEINWADVDLAIDVSFNSAYRLWKFMLREVPHGVNDLKEKIEFLLQFYTGSSQTPNVSPSKKRKAPELLFSPAQQLEFPSLTPPPEPTTSSTEDNNLKKTKKSRKADKTKEPESLIPESQITQLPNNLVDLPKSVDTESLVKTVETEENSKPEPKKKSEKKSKKSSK